MISLLNTTRLLQGPTAELRVLLRDVSDQFGPGDRVGILAAAGSGKSSMARLLSRVEPPDSGHVVHHGRVSWPMGFAGLLHPELTALQNLDVVAGAMGADPLEVIAFCTDFTGLGDYMTQQVKTYSPVMRAGLAFATVMSVPFGMYVADEMVGYGDAETRAKCDAMLERRLAGTWAGSQGPAGLVFLSKNPRQLEKTCTSFRVLVDGALIPCPDMNVAQDVLNLSLARAAEQKSAML